MEYAGQKEYSISAKRLSSKQFVAQVIGYTESFAWWESMQENVKLLHKYTTIKGGFRRVLFENRRHSRASEVSIADTQVVEFDIYVIGNDFEHAWAVAQGFFDRETYGPYKCKF
jgi:hypothetical protein